MELSRCCHIRQSNADAIIRMIADGSSDSSLCVWSVTQVLSPYHQTTFQPTQRPCLNPAFAPHPCPHPPLPQFCRVIPSQLLTTADIQLQAVLTLLSDDPSQQLCFDGLSLKSRAGVQVRNRVLAMSMDQSVTQELRHRICSQCGASTYDASLACHSCQHKSEACCVSGQQHRLAYWCTICESQLRW